jgi:hypothetical protein
MYTVMPYHEYLTNAYTKEVSTQVAKFDPIRVLDERYDDLKWM